MQRMGETHRLAPVVDADRDETIPLQGLEGRQPEVSLELPQADRLAQRQQLEGSAGFLVQSTDPRLHELSQTGRRAERTRQSPDSMGTNEDLSRLRAQHQFPQGENVATARPPQFGRCRRVEGAFQYEMQEGIDTDRVEVGQIKPDRPLVTPPSGHRFGSGFTRHDGGDAEDRTTCHEMVDHVERRAVEAMYVVEDENGQTCRARALGERAAGGVHQANAHDGIFHVAVTELRERAGRQEMGDGTERDSLAQSIGAGPEHSTPTLLCQHGALLGEPGLPDARGAVDAERLAAGIRQGPGERVQLVTTTHQRPPSRDRHQWGA